MPVPWVFPPFPLFRNLNSVTAITVTDPHASHQLQNRLWGRSRDQGRFPEKIWRWKPLQVNFSPSFSTNFRGNFSIKLTRCRSGSDVDAGKIIQEPKLAFLTGAWWIAQGSQKILAGPCHDLRPALDQVRSIYRTWWRSGSEEHAGTGKSEPPDRLLSRLSLHFRWKRKYRLSTTIRIFHEISRENWCKIQPDAGLQQRVN